MSLTDDEIRAFKKIFRTNCDENLTIQDLSNVLLKCGFHLPNWKVRGIIENLPSEEITETIFLQVCQDIKTTDIGSTFKNQVTSNQNLTQIAGTSAASIHSIRLPEEPAFTNWINENLKNDPDHKLIKPGELYENTTDGIIFCKLINLSSPDTIDERVINKNKLTIYRKLENLTLALNSAQAIGCSVINLNPSNLLKATPYLILGLLWQIIRVGLFNQINLENCPGLANITNENEHLNEFIRSSPKTILLRWVNHHLKNAGIKERITNFTYDIMDSTVYTHLLKQIAPKSKGVTTQALLEDDLEKRAELMLIEAKKLGCKYFIAPNDVVTGVEKLNLAFVANLFNNYPGLQEVTYVGREETREEKTYRNWINSIGVSPYIKDLYSDLINGLVLLQIFDHVEFGIVDWKIVNTNFGNEYLRVMQMLENCNYCVDLGCKMGFSLVGISGWDLSTGNVLTLSLLWQLMRAYTLSLLETLSREGRKISEDDIVIWINFILRQKNDGNIVKIKSFQDRSIDYADVILDVIDVLRPNKIDYNLIGDVDALSRAKYAISMARKIGAKVYALPEDIVECNGKMIMTIFACIMALSKTEEELK